LKITPSGDKIITEGEIIMMKLVTIILNKTECLDNLLETFKENNLPGATIIDSKGMIQELSDSDDFRIIGSLRELLMPSHKENKTIIMAARDEDIKVISRIVNEATGGLSNPDTGIMFTVPIDYLEGLSR
jgi:hypothetical protein